jgi:spermidine synthase
MITQAGSPYFATQAYTSIGETIRNAGLSALPLHNQILTLGEWGWYLCAKRISEDEIKSKLISPMVYPVATRWFDDEATSLISSFGKTYIDTMDVGINTLNNPLVYQYYLKGNWKLNLTSEAQRFHAGELPKSRCPDGQRV